VLWVIPNQAPSKTTYAALVLMNPCTFCPHEVGTMAALRLLDTEPMPCPVKTAMRILVIDDDACVGTAIQVILAQRQCETVLASRAHAGIHTFRASAFDVVIVDLFMPGMNGLDTIQRIRRASAVPIIAMSGFRLRNSLDANQDFLGMATLRGATVCLLKPFSPPQLVAAIDRSLELASSTTKLAQ
jgi:CheY-like chemotaxis protein